jgi:hypothetical protein
VPLQVHGKIACTFPLFLREVIVLQEDVQQQCNDDIQFARLLFRNI